MSTWDKLVRIFESNLLRDEDLLEMPHWDFDGAHVFGRRWDMVDFQIEKYPISQEEKKILIHAFITIGFVGDLDGQWVFFSNGAKGQPEVAEATDEQIARCPHLPSGWETYLKEV